MVGSKLACCERSSKSNVNWSVSVFQIEPNTLTIAFSEVLPAAILTNQSIKIGRRALPTRVHGKKRSSPPEFLKKLAEFSRPRSV